MVTKNEFTEEELETVIRELLVSNDARYNMVKLTTRLGFSAHFLVGEIITMGLIILIFGGHRTFFFNRYTTFITVLTVLSSLTVFIVNYLNGRRQLKDMMEYIFLLMIKYNKKTIAFLVAAIDRLTIVRTSKIDFDKETKNHTLRENFLNLLMDNKDFRNYFLKEFDNNLLIIASKTLYLKDTVEIYASYLRGEELSQDIKNNALSELYTFLTDVAPKRN